MSKNVMLLEEKVEKVFLENFSDFWIDFLSHNVFRIKKIIIEIGNINDALIIQAISWHHFLLMIHDTNELSDSSFNNALEMWNSNNISNNKKLTISNIANLTAIPFETVRRHILKLKKKKWINYNKNDGVSLNTQSEINDIIVNKIHPYEKNLLKKAIVSYLKKHTAIE